MGIFNLFGKKSTHEEDLIYLTYWVMWISAHADDDFSEDEQAWFQHWFNSHPQHKMQKLEKMMKTRDFNGEEMQRILNNCSDKEKATLLAEASGIIASDGIFKESEVDSLKLLVNSIGADEQLVRDTILKLHGTDIYNLDNSSEESNQNKDGQVLGFRSHKTDNDK